LPLQRRPPRHKLEAYPVIDHGESTRGERNAPAVDAGDVFAFGGRAIWEASLSREFCGCLAQLPLLQGVEQIAREYDPLALPSSQILFDEMIDPAVHCLAHFGAESAAVVRRLASEQLAVDPGRT
jgi:hypothetical protein